MPPAAIPRRGSSVKENALCRASVDSAGFRKFYESLKESEAELRSWGPEEIGRVLRELQLGKYTDKFAESQIDGSLLIDLDEAVLRDLGLSLFEARKLRKFVFGWRPDSSRAPNHYEKSDKTSKNPSHWDTPTVASILVDELGMKDFAKFCAENQVNGDLLRDIVVDEELLKFLLAGKDMRLNAVKLKNFVLDGWRPQKKKSVAGNGSPYEEPISTTPSKKTVASEYEEPVSPTAVKPQSTTPQTFEEPVAAVSAKRSNSSEPNTPVRVIENKNEQRKASVETVNLVGSAGGVNSLMQKYEQKSNTIGVSPRRGKKSEPTSPSGHPGINYRTKSDAPFVANMKKKFTDGN